MSCIASEPVEVDGRRRLALVLGVGEYEKQEVPDLEGPPNDARRFKELLTRPEFGFPEENVCVLLDGQATTAAFKAAFDELTTKARAQDVVVVFYAGHGSQAKDKNGDETDEWDETLMLHDARSNGVRDLLDDELHGMLARLHERTQDIVLILDSCNSGTATRAGGSLVARFFEPAPPSDEPATQGEGGDSDGGYASAALPGLVSFTAASDGTPALEHDGKGIFTDALIEVLARGGASLSYAQVARQVPPLVSASSYQIPYFAGDLNRPLFGLREGIRPLGWDIVEVGPPVRLSGPPLPGFGVGAELRVYDGGVNPVDATDPGKVLATVIVTRVDGINAEAQVWATNVSTRGIEPGDIARLVRPGDEYLRLKLALRSPQAGGGIPAPRAQALRDLIRSDKESAALIDVVSGGGEFELSAGESGSLVLRGPENRIRNTLEASPTQDATLLRVLRLHARQRALLQLHGEGGTDFEDNETLQVRLVPAAKQLPCAKGEWVQAPPQTEQVIPLCHRWNVRITLAQDAPKPLLVGALILSTDGAVFGLPRDERTVRLASGESVTFDASGETFRGTLPLDTRDQLLVFGTQETNPVAWNRLTATAQARGNPPAGLYRALHRYLQPGTRGQEQAVETEGIEDTTWTMSTLDLRVEASSRFREAASRDAAVDVREYTLRTFDLRPYLPDDRATALYKVLTQADAMAIASRTDGYGYKQHAWNKATDEENLRTGIDCSRAIWFAFTRAGLPYNSDNSYLATADMVTSSTRMADRFDRCPANAQPELGDLLVYRSAKKKDGHVVMVIDPMKKVAWGSHGWDGEAKDAHYAIEPDTGVEYQRIKYKPDWKRWDRQDMQLAACWRYRQFTEDAQGGTGVPGVAALARACDEDKCPVLENTGD